MKLPAATVIITAAANFVFIFHYLLVSFNFHYLLVSFNADRIVLKYELDMKSI